MQDAPEITPIHARKTGQETARPGHVVMISDGETRGGACTAASRLATGLIDQGVRVTRLVCVPQGGDWPWETVAFPRRRADLVRSAVRRVAGGRLAEGVNRRLALGWLQRTLRRLGPDGISLHNLHGAQALGWRPDWAMACARAAPTIWTLHDMWSFTGRCAYSFDCRRFLTGCDASCPTPDEYPALAPHRIAPAFQTRARMLLAGPPSRLMAACPSRWLAEEARAGLWGDRALAIPNGLPLDLFRPVPRETARARLGIRTGRPLVLLVFSNLNERRKGGPLLQALLAHRHLPEFDALAMGTGELPSRPGRTIHHLGYVEDLQTQVLAYNAADLLLHLAPVDNLPNTLIEALACGTPSLALPAGGIPEIVRPGRTGWLTSDTDQEAVVASLSEALKDVTSGRDLRSSCRTVAEEEYGLELQAGRYLDLFERLSLGVGATP